MNSSYLRTLGMAALLAGNFQALINAESLAPDQASIEKGVHDKRNSSELQKRIDAATSGALLQLEEGTLKGPVLIAKPLILRGAGMDKTTIEALENVSAVSIRENVSVRLEKLKIRWSPASTEN